MAPKPRPITTNDARAGTTLHRIRYVLFASLILAVVAMVALVYLAPASDTGDEAAPPVTQT